MVGTSRGVVGLAVLLLAVAPVAAEDRVEWTESANLKTKSIYDEGGNLVFQQHWDKASGKAVGAPLDLRRKAPPGKPAPGGTPTGAAGQAPGPASAAQPPEARVEKRGANLVLVRGSLVQIRIETELHSGRNRKDDRFKYALLGDVKFKDKVVLAKGTSGTGFVKQVVKRGMFGKSGRLELDFGAVRVPGGDSARLVLDQRAEEANERTAVAAGTSGAGLLVLGPLGLVGGGFMKGRDVHIQAGTVTWVTIAEDVPIRP